MKDRSSSEEEEIFLGTKYCSRYDTKLYPMVNLPFYSSVESCVPIPIPIWYEIKVRK